MLLKELCIQVRAKNKLESLSQKRNASSRSVWTVVLLFIMVSTIVSLSAAASPEQTFANSQISNDTSARIEGQVFEKSSGNTISGATIQIPEFGLSTLSDANGRFSWSEIQIPASVHPTKITVAADNFGLWTIEGVRLIASDTLLLEARLGNQPVAIVVPEPNLERAPEERQSELSNQAFAAFADHSNSPLPETIRVRVTGYAYCDLGRAYDVETIDFVEYMQNVLPNEWGYSWPTESYRAGAMAVKMYAWRYIATGGKWSDADVYDSTCDQVYIPGVAYSSTNAAINFTLNWRLLDGSNQLFLTHYLDWFWRCEDYGWQGFCIGQWDTKKHAEGNDGYEYLSWDEMLLQYFTNSSLTYIPALPTSAFNLRFHGNGYGDLDRVKIPIDSGSGGGSPADLGDSDFTIEWWMKAASADNTTPACTASGDEWKSGNILFDRDIAGSGDYGGYGISLANGRIAFGVEDSSTQATLCGSAIAADNEWHHIAVTRRSSDGRLQIYVDGMLDAEGSGPAGDISYHDGRSSSDPNQDPYLVLAARKNDTGPAYDGWMDEIRLSNLLRYESTFVPPNTPFIPDGNTAALYHLDSGYGNTVVDSSGAAGGPSNGLRIYGGGKNGPEWEVSTLWTEDPVEYKLWIPIVRK
jgi:hypothetical protein